MKTVCALNAKERWDFRYKLPPGLNWYPYKLDYLIILLLVLLSGSVIISRIFTVPSSGQQLLIQTYRGQTDTINLNQDTVIHVQGRMGISTVEVNSGRARIISSPCPRKICINQGWISSPGKSIVCIPNGILIKISGQEDIDAVSY
ncbi:MAG: NusG domain II-containing protein [bacterium]